MRRLLLISAALFACLPAGAAQARTSLVEVPLSGGMTVPTLERLGLDVTHDVDERRVRVLLHSQADRRRLAASGFPAKEVVADVDAALRGARAADERAAPGRSALPSGRDLYRELTDYLTELDELAQQHAGLVRRVDLPRRSVEGRPLAGVEIASGVNRTDDGRPAYVVMGLHHAREWPSAEVNMEFALDLARNYGKDPRITQLLDSVRVFVFPVINPDGFLVSRGDSQQIPPVPPTKNLQRKNCQYDASGPSEPCASRQSVDLNRNYGAYWGGNGASESPASDIYRGPGPWSEPEAAAVHEFSQRLHITNFQSIHNQAALILRPPGFKALGLAPDEARLKVLGDAMASKVQNYSSEYGYQLYEVTGATEDWNYVAQNAFGYTIEVGPNGSTAEGLIPFQGPYQDYVVEEYLGEDSAPEGGDGLRESLILAGLQAADTRDHSVVEGTAPPGAVLRLSKSFDTWTSPICQDDAPDNYTDCGARSPAFAIPDGLDTVLAVPASGRYEWHVNPSTRPFERAAGRTEAWTLTCEFPVGTVLERREVVVGIGERTTQNLTCPRAGAGGGGTGGGAGGAGGADGAGGGGSGGGAAQAQSLRLRVVGGRQRLSTILRRGVLVRATCSRPCRVRATVRRRGARRALARRTVTFSRAATRRFRVRLSRSARASLRRRAPARLGLAASARDLRTQALRSARASVRVVR